MSTAHLLVCGHCGQINRIPLDRPLRQARCGNCHEPLFGGHPIAVDETAFNRHAKHTSIPVLVDVWAPWCGPCRAMAPMFERAASVLEPDVRLIKLNSDAAPEVSARLGIRSIPTLLLMQSGRILARTSGAMSTDQIVGWTRSHLASRGNHDKPERIRP